MTEPTKAAMERANELIREVTPDNVLPSHKVNPSLLYSDEAFCRFIDRVDRVAREFCDCEDGMKRAELLASLMLPDEPDLLATVFEAKQYGRDSDDLAAEFRQAADRLGLVIDVRRKGEEG